MPTLQPCSVCGRMQRFKRCLSCAVKAAWQDPQKRANMEAGIARRSQDDKWRSAPHFQRGEQHPRFNGERRQRNQAMSRYKYKEWRTSVFRRDGYVCQDCGQQGGNLIAHHVVPWAKDTNLRYDVDNGVTLCERCHDARHGWSRKPKTHYCTNCGAQKRTGEGQLCRTCANQKSFPDARRVKLKPCAHCGELFKPKTPRTKYCSRKCQGLASRIRLTVHCAYCGKSIELRPSDIKSEKVYCSRSCCVRAVKPRLKR